jgi:hypothetical protein
MRRSEVKLNVAVASAVAGLGLLVSGCADTKAMQADMRDADGLGHAVREDLEAQIANPDAAWTGAVPAANGARAAAAQEHYITDTVKAPVSGSTTSGVASGGGSGG